MKPLGFPLLADENIHPRVVTALRELGKDVVAAADVGLGGRDDVEVLQHAFEQGRVVLTHDSDFGTLAVQAGEPFVGIIYVRPGHISSDYVMQVLAAAEVDALDVAPPFMLVLERRGDTVRLRLRLGRRVADSVGDSEGSEHGGDE